MVEEVIYEEKRKALLNFQKLLDNVFFYGIMIGLTSGLMVMNILSLFDIVKLTELYHLFLFIILIGGFIITKLFFFKN